MCVVQNNIVNDTLHRRERTLPAFSTKAHQASFINIPATIDDCAANTLNLSFIISLSQHTRQCCQYAQSLIHRLSQHTRQCLLYLSPIVCLNTRGCAHLAENWDDLERVGVVRRTEQRVGHTAELKTHEASTAHQNAMCLFESLVEVGDVSDPERDGISRTRQCLFICMFA